MSVRDVAVLGAGTIGASWAAYFSARGLACRVWDPSAAALDGLQVRVDGMQESLRVLDLLVDVPGEVLPVGSPEKAVEGADFIQESAIERLEEKRALYARISAAMGADVVLASSTSFLMPSDLQAGQDFAERLVIGHPFNPPHLIPLVEVVGGKQTLDAAIDQAMAFYAGIDKKPIRLKREANGHLVNRLQAALWREAIHAVRSGLADVEDVDAAVAYGPGLRWALMGPHMIFHMAGGDGGMKHFIDHLGPANEAMWDELGEARLDDETAEALIEGCGGEQGDRSMDDLRAMRDEQLLALLRHVKRVI